VTEAPMHAAFEKSELVADRVVEITYNKDRMNAGEVLTAMQGLGLGIVDVTTKEADLEDVFLRLTSNQ
jgi:ABC-2 type transport system ATP-binding protein